jgi:hypothetical protein
VSLNLILDDIQRAIDGGAPYAALCTSLTLPEICGRCEQQDIYSCQGPNRQLETYERFVKKYLADWPLGLTGRDLTNLRCGISHRGQTVSRASQLRYVFHPPVPNRIVVHNCRTYTEDGEVYRISIDLQTFCNEIATAVRRWEHDNRNSETVQRNLADVLQVRNDTFGAFPVKADGLFYIG